MEENKEKIEKEQEQKNNEDTFFDGENIFVYSPEKIAKYIEQLRRKKQDMVLVISGFTGVGKSTLALQIAYNVSLELNLDYTLIYNRDELLYKIENGKEKDILIGDEVISMLYKRDWYDKDQKELIKKITKARKKRYLLIFLTPSFWNLDPSFRNGLVKMWIHITKRGWGRIYLPSDNEFAEDIWYRKLNEKLLFKLNKKRLTPEKEISILKRSPNFYGLIRFEPLNNYDDYEKVKDEKMFKNFEDPETEKKKREREKLKLKRNWVLDAFAHFYVTYRERRKRVFDGYEIICESIAPLLSYTPKSIETLLRRKIYALMKLKKDEVLVEQETTS